MAVTLQQIAEAAGVSRGTVDRALNNRGRIRPEVEERIIHFLFEYVCLHTRLCVVLLLSNLCIYILNTKHWSVHNIGYQYRVIHTFL